MIEMSATHERIKNELIVLVNEGFEILKSEMETQAKGQKGTPTRKKKQRNPYQLLLYINLGILVLFLLSGRFCPKGIKNFKSNINLISASRLTFRHTQSATIY